MTANYAKLLIHVICRSAEEPRKRAENLCLTAEWKHFAESTWCQFCQYRLQRTVAVAVDACKSNPRTRSTESAGRMNGEYGLRKELAQMDELDEIIVGD